MKHQTRFRLITLISLILLIPIGYVARFHLSSDQEWLQNLLGNIAYESFWIFLVLFLFPAIVPAKAAIGVCLTSIAIELLQLWHPTWLQLLRATLPGRLVLGNSFDWLDLPQYAIGSFLGWLWIRTIKRSIKSIKT